MKTLEPWEIYLRVLTRTARLVQLFESKAPAVIIDNERTLLREALAMMAGREAEVMQAGVRHEMALRCELEGHMMDNGGVCRWCRTGE